jgi:hypothetical protein
MKFNICIIQPQGYIHSLAFFELAELIVYSLRDLNHDAILQFNKIDNDRKNILIGFHLLDIKYLTQIPKDTVLINAEQFLGGTPWNENILKWIKSFEVWDYSQQNIDAFKNMGLSNIHLLRLGYQKELNRIQNIAVQDIDIFFYGSINQRRAQVLDSLKNSGLNVHTSFGVYGKDRDDLIARSKVVLNLHYYDSEIFEVVRVFYLLSNGIPTVGEVNSSTCIPKQYKETVKEAHYNDLISACKLMVENEGLRKSQGKKGLEAIKRHPQAAYTKELLL